jgi:hypothetical protein
MDSLNVEEQVNGTFQMAEAVRADVTFAETVEDSCTNNAASIGEVQFFLVFLFFDHVTCTNVVMHEECYSFATRFIIFATSSHTRSLSLTGRKNSHIIKSLCSTVARY